MEHSVYRIYFNDRACNLLFATCEEAQSLAIALQVFIDRKLCDGESVEIIKIEKATDTLNL